MFRVRVSLAKMESSCEIRENGTESNCSSLFENIHPAFTIVQACIALLIVIFGVPLNLLLVVALIKFRHLMDEAFILCISIFFANTVVSFAMGSNIFLSSATRSWPLGYVGCEIYAFLTYSPIPVRWLTLGMLSIDRFCRVFFPFCYTRQSKIVLKILLIFPWIFTIVNNSLTLTKVLRTYYFTANLPGCFYQANCQGSSVCMASIYVESMILLGTGSILPVVLYTILYIKSRKMLRNANTCHVTSEQQKADNERQNKATKTFALMVITFSCYSAVVFVIVLFRQIPVTQDIGGLFFILSDFTLLYVVTDFLLIWKNKNGKHVIKKLINTVLGKQVFGYEGVISAPLSSTSNQKQSSTNNLVAICTSDEETPHTISPAFNQEQPNTYVHVSSLVTAADEEEPGISLPVSTTNSYQEQLNINRTIPTLISCQEEPEFAILTLSNHFHQQQEAPSSM